jgi:hypothetical protein
MVLLPRLLIFLVLAAFLSRPANLFAFTSFLFWLENYTRPDNAVRVWGKMW